MPKRRKIQMLSATLDQQIQSLEIAESDGTASPKELAQRRRLIALTRRYDKKQPGIKVRDVFLLEAARIMAVDRKRKARARRARNIITPPPERPANP